MPWDFWWGAEGRARKLVGTAKEPFDPTGQFTDEQLHILYCLHILELTPEETVERIWPKAGVAGRIGYLIYVMDAWLNILEMTDSGEMPPFPKEEFLEWTGFPAEPVKQPH